MSFDRLFDSYTLVSPSPSSSSAAQDSQNPLTLPEKQGNPAATASAALPRTPPSSSRLQTPTQFLLPAFPDQSTNPLSDLDYFIYGLEGKAGSEEETGGCGPSSSSSLSRHGLSMSMSFGLDGAADDPEESQQQNKSNFPLASPFAASSSATGRLPSHGPSEEGQQGGRAAGVAVPVPVPAAQATASFHPNNGRHGRPQYNVNKNITATTTTDTRERKVDAEPLITDMGLDMGMATSDCAPNGNANGVATSSQNNGAQHDAATLLQTPPPSSASRRRQQQQQQQQTHEGTNNANGADDGMAQIWTDLDSSSPGWSWSRALQGEDGDGVATPAGMIGMGGGGGMLGADAQQQQQQQLRTPVRTTRWFTHGLEKTPGLGGTGGTGRAFTTPKKEGEPFTSSPVPGAQGKGATSTAANLPSSTPSYAGLLSTPNNAAPTSYDDGYYYPYTDDPLTEMLLQQSGNLFSDFGMGMGMGMGLGGGMGTGTGMGIGPGQVPASSPIPLPAANRGYYGYPQHTHHLQHQQHPQYYPHDFTHPASTPIHNHHNTTHPHQPTTTPSTNTTSSNIYSSYNLPHPTPSPARPHVSAKTLYPAFAYPYYPSASAAAAASATMPLRAVCYDDPAMFLSSPARRIGSGGVAASPGQSSGTSNGVMNGVGVDAGYGDGKCEGEDTPRAKGQQAHIASTTNGQMKEQPQPQFERQPYHHQNEEGRREREMREERRRVRSLLRKQVQAQQQQQQQQQRPPRALAPGFGRSKSDLAASTRAREGNAEIERTSSPIKRAVTSVMPGGATRSRTRTYSGISTGIENAGIPRRKQSSRTNSFVPSASLESIVLKVGEDGRATTEMRISASLDEEEGDDGDADEVEVGVGVGGGVKVEGREGGAGGYEYDDDDDEEDEDEDEESETTGYESDLFSDFEADYKPFLQSAGEGVSSQTQVQPSDQATLSSPVKEHKHSGNGHDQGCRELLPDLAINEAGAAAVLAPRSRSRSSVTVSRHGSLVGAATHAALRPGLVGSQQASNVKGNATNGGTDRGTYEAGKGQSPKLVGADEDEEDDDDDDDDDDDQGGEAASSEADHAQSELRELLARNKNKPRAQKLPTDRRMPPGDDARSGSSRAGSAASGVDVAASQTSIRSGGSQKESVQGDKKPSPAAASAKRSRPVSTSSQGPNGTTPVPSSSMRPVAPKPAYYEPPQQAPNPVPAPVPARTPRRVTRRQKHQTFVNYTPTPTSHATPSRPLTKHVQPSYTPTARQQQQQQQQQPHLRSPEKKPQQQAQQRATSPIPPSSPPIPPSLSFTQTNLGLQPLLPRPAATGPPPSSPTTVTDPEAATATPTPNCSFESVVSRASAVAAGRDLRNGRGGVTGDAAPVLSAHSNGKAGCDDKVGAKRAQGQGQSQGQVNPSENTRCVCRSKRNGGHLMIKCSSCTFWLHTKCIGLLRQTLPTDYLCPFCTRSPIKPDINIQMQLPRMAEMKMPRNMRTRSQAAAAAAAAPTTSSIPRTANGNGGKKGPPSAERAEHELMNAPATVVRRRSERHSLGRRAQGQAVPAGDTSPLAGKSSTRRR